MFKKLSIAIWENMRRNNGPKLSKHSKKNFKKTHNSEAHSQVQEI